jgi:hypothetical protein
MKLRPRSSGLVDLDALALADLTSDDGTPEEQSCRTKKTLEEAAAGNRSARSDLINDA